MPSSAGDQDPRALLEAALTDPDPLARLRTLDQLDEVLVQRRASELLAACEAEGSRAVAEALGITSQAVYQQQRTARQRLAED